MKLHTQRDTLVATLAGVADSLFTLYSDVSSKDRMRRLDAAKDVLPRIKCLLDTIGDVLDETRRV